ncbi:uncharacterized protein [Nicotiana tomentosiformis]|uniref:uncharacterized protein n=1 Tax=Nicotiana tomentosiformis TaxID=4098 RepID=UPI00388C8873
MADALSRKAVSMGSERPLVADIQILANQFVRLVISDPSQDTVRHGGAKQVVVGNDGVLRMQSRICVPNVDGLRELILEETQPVAPVQPEVRAAVSEAEHLSLERYKQYHSPTFSGLALQDVQGFLEDFHRILHTMGVAESSEVSFTTLQLRGAAYKWWSSYELGSPVDTASLTWTQFSNMFLREYVPKSLKDAWRAEFEQLRQSAMTVSEYAVHFSNLSRHAPALIATVRERVCRFIEGLHPSIRLSLARELEMDISYQQVVSIAKRLEALPALSGILALSRPQEPYYVPPISSAPPAWNAFSSQSSRPGPIQLQQPHPQRVCFECCDTRHIVRNCPRLRRCAPPQTFQAPRAPPSPQAMITAATATPPTQSARGGGRGGRGRPRVVGQARYYALPTRTKAISSYSVITGHRMVDNGCDVYLAYVRKIIYSSRRILTCISGGGKANVVADALSHRAESLGSLAYLPATESPLALDVQALDNHFVILDISELSRVSACVDSQSSLYDRIRERQYDGPYLLILRDTVQHGDAKEVTIGDDGTLRMQGRLCVPYVDGLCDLILQEAHSPRLTKSAHIIPAMTTYSSDQLARIYINEIVRLHGVPSERTIQILEDMLCACVMEFGGSWDQFLPLEDFAYNNSYQFSIQIAPYEALYGRWCRSLVGWFVLGEARLLGTDLVQDALEKVEVIRDRLRTIQSRHKSYADRKVCDVAFMVGERVMLRVSAIKGVMRFGNKGKLSPRFIGPFEVLRRVREVAYDLAFPPSLVGVHPVFHVSILRKYHDDLSQVLDFTSVQLDKDLSYVKEPVAILDRHV